MGGAWASSGGLPAGGTGTGSAPTAGGGSPATGSGGQAPGGTGGTLPVELCSEDCQWSDDGECDDGGDGGPAYCDYGTDCADCGPRAVAGGTGGTGTGGTGTGGVTTGTAACGEGTPGTAVGDLAEDWALTDQHGNTVRLSDFCGSVVYIGAGAMWCPGCQADAEEMKSLADDYGARGLVTIDMMAETAGGETPTPADLLAWASTYGLTTPVVADPDWGVWNRYWPGEGTPREMLIGRDGRIIEVGFVETWSLEDKL